MLKDVCSGIGFSTLKLTENGHEVVSIDDNPFFLKKTFERVTSASYKIDKKVFKMYGITKRFIILMQEVDEMF